MTGNLARNYSLSIIVAFVAVLAIMSLLIASALKLG